MNDVAAIAPEDGLECPECHRKTSKAGVPFTAFSLGTHRAREHGYRNPNAKPKKARAPKKDKAPRATTPGAPRARKDLTKLFHAGEVGFLLVGDMYCADVLKARSPAVVDAMGDLVAANPSIARLTAYAAKGSDYAALAVAVVSLAAPIAAHHKLVSPDVAAFLGASPPPVPPEPSPTPIPDTPRPAKARASKRAPEPPTTPEDEDDGGDAPPAVPDL